MSMSPPDLMLPLIAVAQRDVSLELVQSIRFQHAAMHTALLNLERHTGGKQETINAYSLFASPLLSSYRDLLSTYASNIFLVAKVRVSPKLRTDVVDKDGNEIERTMVQYINEKRMESVRDGCNKTMEELSRKNDELDQVLRQLRKETEQLQAEHAANQSVYAASRLDSAVLTMAAC